VSEPDNNIQWKGTDVCIDVYCTCGAHGHYDGYMAMALQCPTCGAIWELTTSVPMRRTESPYHRPQTLHVDEEDA